MAATDNSRRGIGVSPGIAIGPSLVLERRRAAVSAKTLDVTEVESELGRLAEAVGLARARRTAEAIGL